MNRAIRRIFVGASLPIAIIAIVQTSQSRSLGNPRAIASASTGHSPDDLPRAEPKMTPGEAEDAAKWKLLDAPGRPRQFEPGPILEVEPHPKSSGRNRALQGRAAELISRRAQEAHFVPESRLEHFKWMNKSGQGLPILGWKGTILDTLATDEGLVIRVKVRPVLSGGFVTNVTTDETYLISGDVVTPLIVENSDPDGGWVITRP